MVKTCDRSTSLVHSAVSAAERAQLLAGEVLIETFPYNAFGGSVTARMYLPMERSQVWAQLTDYPRWSQYFPDIECSQVVESHPHKPHKGHRLYQTARKNFFVFTAQVEIYLRVFENLQQHIRFRMEQGSFNDFSAELTLADESQGTILSYSVAATPLIPVPSVFIEQAMRSDLPQNMQQMRRILCEQPLVA